MVLCVNLKDGRSLSFDLSTHITESDRAKLCADDIVTGFTLLVGEHSYAVPVKSGLEDFQAGPVMGRKEGKVIGYSLLVRFGGVKAELLVHRGSSPKAARFSVSEA